MEKEGVLVIGSANMDLVVTSERYPRPGETIFGKKFQMFPGGKGANQAVASAKLGIKTYFVGKIGEDEFGNKLLSSMKKDGVKINHIITNKNNSTGTAFIIVDDNGQNEIIVISGSNMDLLPEDIKDKKDLFSEVSVTLCQLEIPIETVVNAANIAKEIGSIFILNPAPAHELPDSIFPCIDIITPNEIELEILSGITIKDNNSAEKAARILLDKGVKNVIVTMGKQGALLVNSDVVKTFPGNDVKAIDTTAAGDAFNGAIAFSLAKNKSLEDAIKFANKAASISVTRMGAQSSMPNYNEVQLS